MLSNHLILCHPHLLLHSISPGLLVFTNELALSSGSQNVRASTSASVLPMNTQGWFSLGLTVFDLLAVQGTLTSLLQHHNLKASILQHSVFFMVQLSHLYMTTGKIIRTDYMDLCWQSNISSFQHTVQICYSFPSKEQVFFSFMAVLTVCSDLESKEIKSVTASTFLPSICHEEMVQMPRS